MNNKNGNYSISGNKTGGGTSPVISPFSQTAITRVAFLNIPAGSTISQIQRLDYAPSGGMFVFTQDITAPGYWTTVPAPRGPAGTPQQPNIPAYVVTNASVIGPTLFAVGVPRGDGHFRYILTPTFGNLQMSIDGRDAVIIDFIGVQNPNSGDAEMTQALARVYGPGVGTLVTL